jgi:ABC-type nitrate/sulfonate/bicarbonate transport system substrate-binding protein
VNRRHFLRNLSVLGAGMATGGLLAPRARAQAQGGAPNLGRMAYQLSWIKNFQFAGEYIADYKGYYRRFGLEGVDLLSGGPNTIVDAVVMSGKALVGQSSPDFMSHAILHGAPLKCIGACLQTNVAGIMSLAKTPIRTPQELIGKRIGLQIINIVEWKAFLKFNRIDPSQVTTIPVQFEFSPLITGEVDGFFGDVNDDAVELKSTGHPVYSLRFSDFGYKMFGMIYSVRADSLQDKAERARLVAFMKGEVLGWQDFLKDPDLATNLTVDVYGKDNGLDRAVQRACCVATNEFIVSPDTEKHGLFWMTDKAIDETLKSLGASGVHIGAERFTNEILAEVYAGGFPG